MLEFFRKILFLLFFLCSTLLFSQNLKSGFIPDFFDNAFFFKFFETRNALPEYSYSFPLSSFLKFKLSLEDFNKVEYFFHLKKRKLFWISPIEQIKFDYMYSSKVTDFSIPNDFGQIVDKGFRQYLSEKGGLGYKNRFLLIYSFKQFFDERGNPEFNIKKLYTKLKLWNLEIEIGKDNLHFGPGQYGILISRNATPFPMIKFQNIEPLNFWGKWNFVFFKGWLPEKRKDISNPELLGLRFVWRLPHWNFLEIGASRTTLYSGEGKPKYAIYEYPSLIAGAKENQPQSIYNNDAYASLDFSFYIPINKKFKTIKMMKFYFQEAGTDIHAMWQVEDLGKPAFPFFFFGFYERAYLTGILFSTSNNIFRLEYVNTAYSFYHHSHYYIEGYTFKGVSLGYPLGINIQKIMFNHRILLDKSFSLFYELGFYEKQAHDKMDHNVIFAIYPLFSFGDKLRHFYGKFSGTFALKNIKINTFFYLNAGDQIDTNPLPTVTKIENKSELFYLFGISTSFIF